MYIEIHEWEDFEQKKLYFKLNNAFNMGEDSTLNVKIAGIYAIYNNNVCLYVGQSKNLASRIATHLSGKYKNSTDIHIWNIKNIGFDDFENRKREVQRLILENSEKFFIKMLKPIENIIANFDFELPKEQIPDVNFDFDADITININEYCIKIFDSYYTNEELICSIDYENCIGSITDETRKTFLGIINKCDGVKFGDKGVLNERSI